MKTSGGGGRSSPCLTASVRPSAVSGFSISLHPLSHIFSCSAVGRTHTTRYRLGQSVLNVQVNIIDRNASRGILPKNICLLDLTI